eukprot:XP_011664327.1 PREDICTED: probable indole-3-acetic acid-amido synthetase GH3.5 [Strongylocentrotus purpuratus]
MQSIMAGTTALRVKLAFVAVVSLAVGIIFVQFAADGERQLWQRLVSGLLGTISILLAVLSLWMASLRIAYGHGLKSAYTQVFIMSVMLFIRNRKVSRCEEAWKNPRKTQEEYLKAILEVNINTEYVKLYGLDSVTSLRDLREKHPLTTYERYRPFVDRMAKGEQGIMTGEQTIRFALTSGTTGKSKMLPYGQSFLTILSTLYMVNIHARVNAFGYGSLLQREINVYTAPKRRYTETEIPIGPASMIPSSMKPLLVIYATPGEGFQVEDPNDALYVHLLFGLRDPNLRSVSCNFTSTVMSAMQLIEKHWPDFVRDIEIGTVSTNNVPPEIHQVLVREMGEGDPERAADLKREFEKGFEGILRRVWPCLKFVQAIDTVGIKQKLLKSYLKGVTLFSRALGATEGVIGINLWPVQEKDEFVLMPSLGVLEFIPENEMHEDQPKTLFIDELEVGGLYEIVITQTFGIYRFRYGDVIRVRRYHLNTPVVEFMYRSGQMLNVKYEKLDQSIVREAIEAAVNHWSNFSLDDYAVAESFLLDNHDKDDADHRPFYVVFLEISPTPDEVSSADISLNKVDEELRLHSNTYNMFREQGSIAPPDVHIVKPGTFDRLHDFILANSTTTANQYKVPRKLRTKETLQLMQDNSSYSM